MKASNPGDRSMKFSHRLLVRCSKPIGGFWLPTRRLPTTGSSLNVMCTSVGIGVSVTRVLPSSAKAPVKSISTR